MVGNLLLKSVGGAGTSGGVPMFIEQYLGSDATGSDGGTSRVITTKGLSSASGELNVFVDTQHLRKTTDYTVSGNDITLIPKIYDTQKISISYLLSSSIILEQETGASATGSDGATSRVLTTKSMKDSGKPTYVFIDTQKLNRPGDYTVEDNKITFLVKLYDTQKIDIYFAIGKPLLEQFVGSDASGTSGATGRVVTATAISSASGSPLIFIDGQHLRSSDVYSVSGNDITFLNKLYDSQKIDVYYIK